MWSNAPGREHGSAVGLTMEMGVKVPGMMGIKLLDEQNLKWCELGCVPAHSHPLLPVSLDFEYFIHSLCSFLRCAAW